MASKPDKARGDTAHELAALKRTVSAFVEAAEILNAITDRFSDEDAAPIQNAADKLAAGAGPRSMRRPRPQRAARARQTWHRKK